MNWKRFRDSKNNRSGVCSTATAAGAPFPHTPSPPPLFSLELTLVDIPRHRLYMLDDLSPSPTRKRRTQVPGDREPFTITHRQRPFIPSSYLRALLAHAQLDKQAHSASSKTRCASQALLFQSSQPMLLRSRPRSLVILRSLSMATPRDQPHKTRIHPSIHPLAHPATSLGARRANREANRGPPRPNSGK